MSVSLCVCHIISCNLIFCFKEHFGSGLSVMMKALTDLQAKGDLLVKEITKQKTTLDDLKSRIHASETNLTKVNNMIDNKESFLSRLQMKILQSQKDFTDLGDLQIHICTVKYVVNLKSNNHRFCSDKEKKIAQS